MGFHLTPTGHLLDFYPTPAKPLLNFWGTSTGLLSDLFLTLYWNSCPRAHAHAATLPDFVVAFGSFSKI